MSTTPRTIKVPPWLTVSHTRYPFSGTGNLASRLKGVVPMPLETSPIPTTKGHTIPRTLLMALLCVALSACGIVASNSDENRPEQFAFTPSPAGLQETIDAFRDVIGPGGAGGAVLDEATVKPLGKIETSRGAIFFADFQTIDSESGRSQCSGSAGPGGGGWGCGPIGLLEPPEDLPMDPVMISGTGSSGTWSEVQLRVSDDVAYLSAVADDGTAYRMEPVAGNAWMEWKSSHGDLRITGFDSNDNPLGSVDAPPT